LHILLVQMRIVFGYPRHKLGLSHTPFSPGWLCL